MNSDMLSLKSFDFNEYFSKLLLFLFINLSFFEFPLFWFIIIELTLRGRNGEERRRI